MTLEQFLVETYEPWVRTNRVRTARNTLEKLRFTFKAWMPDPLSAITVERIELWKGRRLRSGTKSTTVLRELFTLSSVLTRAVRTGRLASNPIRLVEKPRFDRRPRVRFLSIEEETRLRDVLADRDRQLRAARLSYNAHLAHRSEPPLPDLPHFGDHLTPAILLSMNTGLRLGETRRLRWDWVDLEQGWLTVDGAHAKTRHVALNEEAIRVLTQWREQSGPGPKVFEVKSCFKTAWSHVLQKAGIVGFRWHDLRHHFASRLVQTGTPLNTVRDLLGHTTVAMSLRYSHLAPDQRREAVARLRERPVLSVNLQLPSGSTPTPVLSVPTLTLRYKPGCTPDDICFGRPGDRGLDIP